MRFRPLCAASVVLVLSACDRTPPEPIKKDNVTTTTSSSSSPSTGSAMGGGGTQSLTRSTPTRGGQGNVVVAKKPTSPIQPSPDDPIAGKWTIEDAQKAVPGTGAFVATIDTSMGAVQCKLEGDKAPITTANFVGLATGKRVWKHPVSKKWVNSPAYDNTTFHRVIQGFMIQGGDAAGNGMGDAGYEIPDEVWENAVHDRAGLLCMANKGPDTNSAQFFITDAKAAHLDNGYTIFGECAPLDVVHKIAGVEKNARDKPLTPVTIKKVTISRADPKKKE